MKRKSSWPFAPLQRGVYEVILADPPYYMDTRSKAGATRSQQAHYNCMALTDIFALDVSRLAARDAWLLLWTTAPHLVDAVEIMREWGFIYKSNIIWDKRFVSGEEAMGMGFIARSRHEQLLIGSIGAPRYIEPFISLFNGVRREHSRKPEELYPMIDAFAPGARRVELFARRRRADWDVWGDQTDYFSETP